MKSYTFVFIFCALVYYFFIHQRAPKPLIVGGAPRFRLAPIAAEANENSSRTLASLKTAAAGPVVDARKNSHPEIMELVRNNDACGLLQLVNSQSAKPLDLTDVFIDLYQLEELRPLIGSESVFYKNREAKTEKEKYFQALALGGTSSRYLDQIEANPEKALSLLSELNRQHPNNAAYGFLMLQLQEQAGLPAAQLRETVKTLQGANEFDLHTLKIERAIHAHMWDSAAVHILTSYVTGTVPRIDLHPGNQIFSHISEASDREHLAELTTREGKLATKDHNFSTYNMTQYAIGQSYAPDKYRPLQELHESQVHPREGVFEEYPGLDVEACDQTALDQYIEDYRGSY